MARSRVPSATASTCRARCRTRSAPARPSELRLLAARSSDGAIVLTHDGPHSPQPPPVRGRGAKGAALAADVAAKAILPFSKATETWSVPAALFPHPAIRPLDPMPGHPRSVLAGRLDIFAAEPGVFVLLPRPVTGCPHHPQARGRRRGFDARRRGRGRRDDRGRDRAAGDRLFLGDRPFL